MHTRIKELRKSLHLTQTEFGKQLGLTKDQIANIEGNRVKIKDSFIKSLCLAYGVNEEWLINGNGEMLQKKEVDIQALIDTLQAQQDPMVQEFINIYSKLDDDNRIIIKKLAEEMLKNREHKDE